MRYLVLLTILIFVNFTYAGNWIINPNDDGYIYPWGVVNTNLDVVCGGAGQGVIEFPIDSINGKIQEATLSINPYALPLWSPIVHVYGYSSNDGLLTMSDYDAGVFLGDLTVSNLSFGQDAYFDVTSFLKTVTTPYVGFNLRTEHTDVFSSLEENYGHPSQLSISTIPEPATLLLFTIGGLFLRKRKA
jgi:hypothetical protein